MPSLGKEQRRPWMPQSNTSQSGRLVKNEFYQSAAWRKVRNTFIASHPLCCDCEKIGRTTPATVVDHVKQINRDNAFDTQGGKFGEPLSWSNLQPLCTFHHNQKSGRERHGK